MYNVCNNRYGIPAAQRTIAVSAITQIILVIIGFYSRAHITRTLRRINFILHICWVKHNFQLTV